MTLLTSNFWIYSSLNLLFTYHRTTLERQFSYIKWFAGMPLWQSNNLSTILCRQSFLVQCLLSIYWKLLSILERIWFFFLWFLNQRVFDKFIQFNSCPRIPLIFFIALMFLPTANWRVWPWQCVKQACDSIWFICIATPVLARTMLDVPSWH